MSTQAEVDEFIDKAQAMTSMVIAFMGEAPTDASRTNIRRMRTATAALQAALEQANMWAMAPPLTPPAPLPTHAPPMPTPTAGAKK